MLSMIIPVILGVYIAFWLFTHGLSGQYSMIAGSSIGAILGVVTFALITRNDKEMQWFLKDA